MKRSFLLSNRSAIPVVAAGTALIGATYGLVRLAYGLFLPDVSAELSFDADVAGLIASGGSVAYCGGAVVGFLVAARHPQRLVVAAALAAGLGAAGMALANQTGVFAAFAIASSAGAGLASPALVEVVRRNVSAASGVRAQAVVNAGTGPGLAAAGALALLLLPDWRLAWSIVAVLTFTAAGLVLGFDRSRDRRAGRRHRSRSEGPGGSRVVPPVTWFVAHGWIITAAFLMGAGSAAVWTYGRTLLVEAGVGEPVSIAAWIALGLGGAVVIGTARLLETLQPRWAWAISVSASAAGCAVLSLAPDSAAVALGSCVLFGWGYTAGSGALIASTMRLDPARGPAGTSLLFVTLILGQAVGAAVLGRMITEWGFPPSFLAAAVVTAAAAMLPLAGAATSRRP